MKKLLFSQEPRSVAISSDCFFVKFFFSSSDYHFYEGRIKLLC
jgi:hypothetical protein